jgi:hypothetical protein
MEGLPVASTSEFCDDVNKKRKWTAVCAKNKSYVKKTEFNAVMEGIRTFLALPLRTVQEGHIRPRRRGSPADPGVDTVINALRSRSFVMRTSARR